MAFRYDSRMGSLASIPPTFRRTRVVAPNASSALKTSGPTRAAETSVPEVARNLLRVVLCIMDLRALPRWFLVRQINLARPAVPADARRPVDRVETKGHAPGLEEIRHLERHRYSSP